MELVDSALRSISPYYANFIFGFHAMNIATVILYTYYGINIIKEDTFRYINTSIQLFVCLFLMLRYHPYREHKYYKHDAGIIFGSASFLLINLGITEYLYGTIQAILDRIPTIAIL
tara:strand:- start:265 stop:612 length:348 start_codon:yes stop_codon:yes gene_type:complete